MTPTKLTAMSDTELLNWLEENNRGGFKVYVTWEQPDGTYPRWHIHRFGYSDASGRTLRDAIHDAMRCRYGGGRIMTPTKLTPKYKWKNDGDFREYIESTTRKIQYYWLGPRDGDECNGLTVSIPALPWTAEIHKGDRWHVVGYYHTGREAKREAVKAYEAFLAGVEL